MNSVRQEIALANAQELMNVRRPFLNFDIIFITLPDVLPESERSLFPEMRHQTWDISFQLRAGQHSTPSSERGCS